MATLAQIYDWFMTGKKPTQAQFWASWGSFWHKSEGIPQSAVSGLEGVLNAKAERDQFDAHKVDADAHAALFLGKEDKAQKGVADGYVPLNEFIKIAHHFLSIVNDLTTGGATSLLSAEQGLVLQTQINAINLLLSSDDVNLDTVQELVNAIKEVETSLETILVNDLTTGGTTKALTAEMGKTLKGLIDYQSSQITSINATTAKKYKAIVKDPTVYGAVYSEYSPGGSQGPYALSGNLFVFTNNADVYVVIPEDYGDIPDGTSFSVVYIGSGIMSVEQGTAVVDIRSSLPRTLKRYEVRTYTYVNQWNSEYGGYEYFWLEEGDFGQTLTGNSTTFLKADGSRDSSSYVKHLVRDAVGSSLHSEPIETIFKSYLIPANTLSSNDFLNFDAVYFETSSSPFIGKIYLNSTPTLVGAELLATISTDGLLNKFAMCARYLIDAGYLKAIPSSELSSNLVTLTESTPIAVSLNKYIIITGVTATHGTSDFCKLRSVRVTN